MTSHCGKRGAHSHFVYKTGEAGSVGSPNRCSYREKTLPAITLRSSLMEQMTFRGQGSGKRRLFRARDGRCDLVTVPHHKIKRLLPQWVSQHKCVEPPCSVWTLFSPLQGHSHLSDSQEFLQSVPRTATLLICYRHDYSFTSLGNLSLSSVS